MAMFLKRGWIAGLIAVVFCWSGCHSEPPARHYRAVHVTAKQIDPQSGIVAIDWLNEKTGQVETYQGWITRDTEVLINGVIAAPDDIHVGDSGIVVVYPSSDRSDLWMVCSVDIERNNSDLLKKTPTSPVQGKP